MNPKIIVKATCKLIITSLLFSNISKADVTIVTKLNNSVDSLKNILKDKHISDKNKFDIYCYITNCYALYDMDNTIIMAHTTIKFAEKIGK